MPIKFTQKQKPLDERILEYLQAIKSPDEGATLTELSEKLSVPAKRISEVIRTHPILKKCKVTIYNSVNRYVFINPKYAK